MSEDPHDSTDKDDIYKDVNSICERVQQQLGCLHGRESFYKKAIAAELIVKGYNVKVECAVPVEYTTLAKVNISVGNVYIDIACDTFFIELKNVKNILATHLNQCKLYSKLTGKKGYLINFSTMPNEEIQIKIVGG